MHIQTHYIKMDYWEQRELMRGILDCDACCCSGKEADSRVPVHEITAKPTRSTVYLLYYDLYDYHHYYCYYYCYCWSSEYYCSSHHSHKLHYYLSYVNSSNYYQHFPGP